MPLFVCVCVHGFYFSFLLDVLAYLRVGLMSHLVALFHFFWQNLFFPITIYPSCTLFHLHPPALFLPFEDPPNCFPWYMYHLAVPPAMHEHSNPSISLPIVVIVCPHDYHHPGGYCVHLFKRQRGRVIWAAPTC